MQTDSEILNQFETIFKEVFDDPNLKISIETTANDIDGWDSVMHINLIMMIESHFNTRFRTGEIAALKNVGDFINLVKSSLK